MRRTPLLVALLLAVAPPGSVAGPHDEGLAAGRAANLAARPTVGASQAAAVVPGYATGAPQAALYRAPALSGAAGERIAACVGNKADTNCQALLTALQSANTPRERIAPNDPLFGGARNAASSQTFAALRSMYDGCAAGGPCPTDRFCIGADCFDTSYTNDADFARMTTFLEAAREAGVYLDPVGLTVFNGEDNRCRDRLLNNCCRVDGTGTGMTNRGTFGVGSKVVYDVLTNSTNQQFIHQGFSALLSGTGFSGSFSSYGVTVALNGATIPAGSTAIASSGSMVVAFDPWSLAITVIVYVALDAMSCNDRENLLALKRGASLCREIGSYCSRRLLGSCLTRTHTHCCFNSLLARIVNEQGRTQVARAWGTARAPDCGGFTIAQLQSLDFAALDLSEFYASIVPVLPDVAAIRASNAARLPKCYAGQGKC